RILTSLILVLVVLLRLFFCFCGVCYLLYPLTFPTRRSSDLRPTMRTMTTRSRCSSSTPTPNGAETPTSTPTGGWPPRCSSTRSRDRKSTRLNSSHVSISYAVFCLQKKTLNRLHHANQMHRSS